MVGMVSAITVSAPNINTVTNLSPFQDKSFTITYDAGTQLNNISVVINYTGQTGGLTSMVCNGKQGKTYGQAMYFKGFDLPSGTHDINCQVRGWGTFKYDLDIYKNDNLIKSIDPWFNSTWQNRKGMNVTFTAQDVTGYEVPINITAETDMQSDFDDLRFTKADGTTLLDYMIADESSTNWVYVFVEMDLLTNDSGNIQGYMYWNNSLATNVSNGVTTANFFSNFTDLSQWNTFSGAPATDGTLLTISTGAGTEKINTTTHHSDLNTSTIIKNYVSSCAGIKLGIFGATTNTNDEGTGEASHTYWWQSTSGAYHGSVSASATTQNAVTLSTAFTMYEIYRNSTVSSHLYSGHGSNQLNRITTNIPTVSLAPIIGARDNCDMIVDWYMIVDRLTPQAEVTFSSEEFAPVTTFNLSINAPVNNTTITINSTDVNFTVTGSEVDYNCSLWFNGTVVDNNATTLDSTLTTLNSSEFINGVYDYYVNCTSNSVTNTSLTNTITIAVPTEDTSFYVTLNTPLNNTSVTDDTPTMTFFVIGNQLTYNCTLFISGGNFSSGTANNNTLTSIVTSPSIGDGTYEWNISCYHFLGVSNSSLNRTITINSTGVTGAVIIPEWGSPTAKTCVGDNLQEIWSLTINGDVQTKTKITPCSNGCDSVNGTCNPEEGVQWLIVIAILIGILIVGWIIKWW